MRKGMLVYVVLMLCSKEKIYSANIIRSLQKAELIVVEGTLYPLLSRLIKDSLLAYEWQESLSGPPRKYIIITPFGQEVLLELRKHYKALDGSIKQIEKGLKNEQDK